MKQSSYNKGRTVANVSSKTYIHGTREYLRPDTVWADERYSKITQQEINEAKIRVAKREEEALKKKNSHSDKHGHVDHHKKDKHHDKHEDHGYHYDFKHVAIKQPKELY